MLEPGRALNLAASRLVQRERKARGLTQEALADICSLDRTYVSAIERGQRNITLNALGQILQALDLTPANFAAAVLED